MSSSSRFLLPFKLSVSRERGYHTSEPGISCVQRLWGVCEPRFLAFVFWEVRLISTYQLGSKSWIPRRAYLQGIGGVQPPNGVWNACSMANSAHRKTEHLAARSSSLTSPRGQSSSLCPRHWSWQMSLLAIYGSSRGQRSPNLAVLPRRKLRVGGQSATGQHSQSITMSRPASIRLGCLGANSRHDNACTSSKEMA